MRAAVTGASGVVGAAVLRHLLAEGNDVRALARSEFAANQIRSSGATPVRGDVLDPDSLPALLEGVERVFHVAGVNEMCSADPTYMDRVNVIGSMNMLEAARHAGVGRFVHTSSAATIGEVEGTVGTEESPHRGRYQSRYERSKHLAELKLGNSADGVDVVFVNPSSVQGPGRATGTGKLILDIVNKKLGFLVDTTVSIVDIDDCARGHLQAAESGQAGERYILSGSVLDMRGAVAMLNRMGGYELNPRYLPSWLVRAGAGMYEFGARLSGRTPGFCREMATVMLAGHRYDGSKASRDLNLAYTPVEKTIQRTLDWFAGEGLIGVGSR